MMNRQRIFRNHPTLGRGSARRRSKLGLAAVGVLVMVNLGAIGAVSAGASVRPSSDVGPVATTVVASPISVVQTVTTLQVTLSARLTVSATGVPVSGEQVWFIVPNTLANQGPFPGLICTPETNANGVASCSVNIQYVVNALLPPVGYLASFQGSPGYLASTDRAYFTL